MEPVRKATQAHECRSCSSPLIQPLEWLRMDDQWQVLVHCPECENVYELSLDQEAVNHFSYELEAGFQSLLEAIEELDRDLFRVECETFIAAVRAGQIYPMDF